MLALFPFLCLTFSLHCVLGRLRKWRCCCSSVVTCTTSSHKAHHARLAAASTDTAKSAHAPLRDVHLLHLAQSVPMLDENSALRGNMPQRDDDDGGKNPRLSFSPASSVWGQTGCPWTSIGHIVTGTTEKITEADYVAFFHQFFGFTNNPAVAPLANVQYPYQRYLMGGDGAWDHINSCNRHSANWSIAHEHVLQALELICQAAGYATSRKRVLPSEGNRRADLEVRNIRVYVRVAGKTDLLIDITIRHNFIGAGRSGHTQGRLRNPDASSRAPLPTRSASIVTHITAIDRWPFYRRACLHRDVSMASSCVCFSSSPTSKPTITLQLLATRHTRKSFVTAAVSSFTATGAPLGWRALRLWRSVVPQPSRVAMFLYLAGQVAGEVRGCGLWADRDDFA